MSDTWARYNCIDSAVTHKIKDEIVADIYQQGYEDLYRDTIDLFPAIIFMQTVGLELDKEALKKEKTTIDGEIKDAETKLYELCGFELNPNSPKQCQQYFYGVLGYPPYTGRTGNITTDDTAMSRLVRKGCKEAGFVQTIRGLKKLRSTYLDVQTDSDGRIRSSFNPRGATTGRLSSSQTIFGTGLNFQNLDPRFKRFIKADDGRIFISMDKAQAEWVITAYVCGDPKMISAIENKEDIHSRTIHEMSGVPFDLIAKDNKVVGKLTDADDIFQLRSTHIPELLSGDWNFLPRNMSLRQCGKKTNHGCNYLETYKMFALLNEISETDAKVYVGGYRDTYVMLPIWWDAIGNQLHKNRTIYDVFGHKRRFLGELNHDLKKQAVAFVPQASSVWVLNYAMRDWYKHEEDPLDDLWLHAQVHDELLFSFPIGDWNRMAEAIYIMENYMTPQMSYEGRDFRIGTDLAVGLYWGEKDEKCPQGVQKVKIPACKTIGQLAENIEAVYKSIT